MHTPADSLSLSVIPITPKPSPELGMRSRIAARLGILESIFDLCLVIAIVCVPLTMAGIQEIGVGLFVLCSFTMGLVWSLRQVVQPVSTARFSGAEALVLLSLSLVGLQLAELSPSLLRILSPYSAESLTIWGSLEGRLLGTDPWRQISMTPELTRSGLVLLLTYATFFLSLVHRLQETDDIDRILRLIAFTTLVMAVIGLGQLFFGNGRYLWMFEHPNRPASGVAKGTFVNANHFAGFLALGIGPLVWCWKSRDQQALTGQHRASWQTHSSFRLQTALTNDWPLAAIAVIAVAALFSLSRGGILMVCLAGVVALLASTKGLRATGRVALPAIAFAVAGVVAFGADSLTDEVHSVTSASSIQELWAGRALLWSALLRAVPWFWPAGSGLGSHAEVYPTWLSTQDTLRFSHAENGYLQVLLELGLPGLLLLVAGLTLCARWCWTGWKQGDAGIKLRMIALTAGLLVTALHSLIDFVWYIPGYTIAVLALAACACRCSQLATPAKAQVDQRPESARPLSGTVFAWTVLLCILPLGRMCADVVHRNVSASEHWQAYRGHAIRGGKQLNDTSTASIDSRLDLMIAELEQCLEADPLHHRALTNLAALLLRRFELGLQNSDNRMTLRQIQDTIQNADFTSDEEMHAWLHRAFGDRIVDLERAFTAARQGLQGQPLRGEAYIVLAETGFLEGLSEREKSALIDVAVRLRPHEPAVLYSAGALTARTGDLDGAFDLWRQAYAHSPAVRQQLTTRLAPALSALEFAQRLNPDTDGLWLLSNEYGKLDRTEEQLATAKLFVLNFDRLEASADELDVDFWTHADAFYAAVGEDAAALECLQRAAHLKPQDNIIRRKLIFDLIEHEKYDVALRHLDWYRLRYPEDQEIKKALAEVRSQANLKSTVASRERRVQ